MATLFSSIEPLARIRMRARSHGRVTLSLPALIATKRSQRAALVKNLGSGGAFIEVATPLQLGSEVVLSCGTLQVSGVVVWQRRGRCGIWFFDPIEEKQVIQQLAQSELDEYRRRPKYMVN